MTFVSIFEASAPSHFKKHWPSHLAKAYAYRFNNIQDMKIGIFPLALTLLTGSIVIVQRAFPPSDSLRISGKVINRGTFT